MAIPETIEPRQLRWPTEPGGRRPYPGPEPEIVGGAEADIAIVELARIGWRPVDSFLTRAYKLIDDHLDDPHTTRRLTPASKYRDLATAEAIIWATLMRGTGQESNIGRTETILTLQDSVQHYMLPGNFQEFIRLEYREDGDPNSVSAMYRSIPMHSPDIGIQILGPEEGALIQPVPDLSADKDFTLIYRKGPIMGHTAGAKDVTSHSLTLGEPVEGYGEVVRRDEYYTGSLMRVSKAAMGAPQTRKVVGYNATTGVCEINHPWSPTPSGDVMYEFGPVLSMPLDAIYPLSVAIEVAGRRALPERRGQLIRQFREMLASARVWVLNNVADRGPTRILTPDLDEVDPYV